MNNETKQTIINAITAILLVTLIAGAEVRFPEQKVEVLAKEETTALESTTEVQNTIVEEVETPETYIKKVFGEHSDKAFLLLKGKGPGSCAENRNLDQNAKNVNWIKGKPGEYWSTDWGIFQINDKFHPVEQLNLRTDFKANIDYAWRMYKNDNYSFVRWTCGRFYKI